MRGDMHGIKLDRDAQMLDRFLQIPAFLQQLVAKTVPSQKSLGVLGHHLSECIKIHHSLHIDLRVNPPLFITASNLSPPVKHLNVIVSRLTPQERFLRARLRLNRRHAIGFSNARRRRNTL
jgi:hypothetical protein